MYIVESPLQLLSAIEAANFDVGKKVLVIAYDIKKRVLNNIHIDSVLKYSNYDKIFTINKSNNRFGNWVSWFSVTCYVRFCRKSIGTVYMGDWQSIWMHRLIEISFCKNVYLLDDGVVVLDVVKNKLTESNHNKLASIAKPNTFKLWIKTLIYRALGSNSKGIYSIKLFTAFDAMANPNCLPLTKNNFTYIKSLLGNQGSKLIYYFGSKSSENGYLSLDDELSFMQSVYAKLSALYPCEELIYIPHRDSKKNKVDLIAETGFVVKYIDSPVEVYFLEVNELPLVIAGSHTTALANLMAIYNIKAAHVFKLPMNKVYDGKKILANEIFDFYKQLGFDMIDVELP